MPNLNTLVEVTNLSNDARTVDIVAFITAPANGAYTLISKTSVALLVQALHIRTASGTVTAQLRINGTNIVWTGSATNLSVSVSDLNTLAISSSLASIGSRLELVLSASAVPISLEMTMKCQRVAA